MSDKDKADPVKVSALKALTQEFKGVDAPTQRNRLRKAFELYPRLTTAEIREHLDILHPPGRVKELRDDGCVIVLFWVNFETDHGVRHRIGQYLFVPTVDSGEVEVAHA